MSTRVRSYSKINLGLAIGPVRPDGFHELTTLYQTLDLHDLVTVSAKRASENRIVLTTNHPFVPRDARNTAWKMVERCLERLGVAADVAIHIEKKLPVQGGMGAGSANAVAALLGLERELGLALPGVERLKLAAEVGSDVPLFLLGGAVLGLGRGEQVIPMPDLPRTHCLVVVPEVGVSTPQAFRDWDARAEGLTSSSGIDRLDELSLAYSSLSAPFGVKPTETTGDSKFGTSGIVHVNNPEKKRELPEEVQADVENDLAGNTLLALVRTGIENDFEQVVFPQYPFLRSIKRQLMGSDSDGSALYAALSGSGSALFGLYMSETDAKAAQQRIQSSVSETGVRVFLTHTLPRTGYWSRMFAE